MPENWYALFGETNEADRLARSPDQYDKQTGTFIILELVRSPDPQKKGLKETKQKKEEKTVVPTPRKRGNIWEPEVRKALQFFVGMINCS